MFQKSITFKIIMLLILSTTFSLAMADSVIELIEPPKPNYTDQNPRIEWIFHVTKALTLLEADIQDIKRIPVVSLLEGNDSIKAGNVKLVWIPNDKDQGNYPDGIYFLTLVAKDSDGMIHEFPGDEEFSPFGLRLDAFEINRQTIQFDNPRRGLVTVRIGYGSGSKKALCASPVNWEFMSEGHHVILWESGMFEKQFDLSVLPDLHINYSCYPLPEGCFKLSRGHRASNQQFENTMNERDLLFLHDANRYRYEIARGDFELDVKTQLIRNNENTGYRLIFNVSAEKAPAGWLETPGIFHELKIFLDEKLIYLSRVDSFPFSDEVHFNVLAPGDNRLVINAWDYSNRFGYWTGVLNPDDVN